ncbi:hypothetical protein SAMN03159341_10773 [Paenibacillus sp. 1_12]|nr:hypothetical protein SAMN03159341_10773 [Paenibacillus sp. 1_12]
MCTEGNISKKVYKLKQQPVKDLSVSGSLQLVHSIKLNKM